MGCRKHRKPYGIRWDTYAVSTDEPMRAILLLILLAVAVEVKLFLNLSKTG
jgi:uncharacterized membrane protein